MEKNLHDIVDIKNYPIDNLSSPKIKNLVEKYNISYFNNKITRFSILSNSTPDKLIQEFKKFNIKVSTENNLWTLNE